MRITPSLALFLRSLRLEARSVRVFAVRLLLGGMIWVALLFAHKESSTLGAAGLEFFEGVTFINFYFISLAGLSYFASAITEEKEEMTLGLLLMTGLSPVSILLGKSTSRLFGALLLLAAQFPFTLLAVTLGGVSQTQIYAVYVTLLAYLFGLSNFALFWSVLSLRSVSAAFWTGLFAAGFFLLPVLGKFWIGEMTAAGHLATSGAWATWGLSLFNGMIKVSPWNALLKIFATGFTGPVLGADAAASVVFGVIFFLLAWISFGWFTREQQEVAPARGFGVVRRNARGGIFSAGRAWGRAVVWKDFYFLSGGISAASLKFLFYGGLISTIAYANKHYAELLPAREVFGSIAMLTMLVALVVEALGLAGRMFAEELRWKTWPTLLTLPLSLKQILRRKLLGGLLGLAPVVLWFGVGMICAPDRFSEALVALTTRGAPILVFFLVSEMMFLLYLVAYLSVIVKRLAAFLAVGVLVAGNVLAGMILGSVFPREEEVFLTLSFLAFALTLVLHSSIPKQLERRAAE